MHMIAVNPQGQWNTKIVLKTTDEAVFSLSVFDNDTLDDNMEADMESDSEEENENDVFDENVIKDVITNDELKNKFITEGSYEAIPSHSQSIQQFFLCKLEKRALRLQISLTKMDKQFRKAKDMQKGFTLKSRTNRERQFTTSSLDQLHPTSSLAKFAARMLTLMDKK